ncbi:MAG: PQQ-binding-like beta-propeller repeat protein [Candidatus Bathyarchaeota archaeon]|nr:PQQ-binding-like beta-propeller repeat protein [Candidatus Bathyarchaeota archaeon]
MSKRLWLLISLLVLVLLQSCLSLNSAVCSVNGGWPMFRHDPAHSGAASNVTLENNPQLLWNFTANAAVTSSPAVSDGYVCFGSKDYNIYCLNATSGQPVWNFTTCAEVDSSPAIWGGFVFVGSGDGWLYCLNLASGVPLWASVVEGKVQSSPAVADGAVYVGSGKHEFFCFNATDGSLLWKHPLPARVYSSPVVADGVVYFAADNYFVYALNATTGAELWSSHTGSQTDSPCLLGGVVYTGSYDGYICALNASSGEAIWRYLTGGCVVSSPAAASGCVYAGSDDNFLYCLDAAEGTLVWRAPTGFWVRSSPAIVDGRVYVGSQDYYLYCLDAQSGAVLWRFETGSYVDSSPACADGVLYVGSADGHLYALRLGGSAQTLPTQASVNWSTVLFDAVFLAVAAAFAYLAVGAYRGQRQVSSAGDAKRDSWITRHLDAACVVAILAFSTVFYLNLSSGHLWAADEQTYVQWAFHMYRSGDYITPWASGTVALWIGKPPLFMWLLSLSFQVFGATNFAARFWSPIFAGLAMVAVYFLGKTLYNRASGFASALVLGTFSTFFCFARLAMTDMAFLFFVLSSLTFAVKHQKTPSSRYILLCGVFFGLALMTKQVVAFAVPLLILLYLLATKKSIKLLFSRQYALRFWGVAMLIFLPWPLYMTAVYGGGFLDWFFVFSDFSRAAGALEGHAGGLFYYFSYLWGAEWWWMLLLPFAVGLALFRGVFRRSQSDLFVLGWMLLVLSVFSLIQTKLEWYILPVFPAFALSIGSLLYQLGQLAHSKRRKRAA